MKILVVNCGSSSLKFQLIDSETEEVAASGLCERIGLDGALIYKVNGDKIKQEIDLPDHEVAIKKVLDTLLDKEIGVLTSLDEIGAIGHRMVHGGEKFSSSVIINRLKRVMIWLHYITRPICWVFVHVRKLCRACRMLWYLIQHFIRQCHPRHICTLFQRNIMRNTVFVAMVSMEPVIASYPRDWQNLQDWILTIPV